MRFVKACIRLGVDGFYASTQGGEAGRFKDPGVFTRHVKPFDLVLMNEMKRACPFNILHVCDYNRAVCRSVALRRLPGPHRQLQSAVDGTHGALGRDRAHVRAAVHGRDGPPWPDGTRRARRRLGREVNRVLGEASRPFMLGADCTLPGDIKWENIRAAIDAATRTSPDVAWRRRAGQRASHALTARCSSFDAASAGHSAGRRSRTARPQAATRASAWRPAHASEGPHGLRLPPERRERRGGQQRAHGLPVFRRGSDAFSASHAPRRSCPPVPGTAPSSSPRRARPRLPDRAFLPPGARAIPGAATRAAAAAGLPP